MTEYISILAVEISLFSSLARLCSYISLCMEKKKGGHSCEEMVQIKQLFGLETLDCPPDPTKAKSTLTGIKKKKAIFAERSVIKKEYIHFQCMHSICMHNSVVKDALRN